MMLSACVLLPCAFLRDLHSVSMLSFWCGVSHIAINVIILGYCLLQIFDWHYSQMSFRGTVPGTWPLWHDPPLEWPKQRRFACSWSTTNGCSPTR
jgi:uncharacterized membrane protein